MALALRFVPFIIVLIVMAYFSHIPSGPMFFTFPNSDKLGHFGMFFLVGMTFTFGIDTFKWAKERKRSIMITLLVGALLGVIDEFHQSFVPRRTVSVGDWIADFIGVLTFTVIWAFFHFQRILKNR